jgi:hypothetical protein
MCLKLAFWPAEFRHFSLAINSGDRQRLAGPYTPETSLRARKSRGARVHEINVNHQAVTSVGKSICAINPV